MNVYVSPSSVKRQYGFHFGHLALPLLHRKRGSSLGMARVEVLRRITAIDFFRDFSVPLVRCLHLPPEDFSGAQTQETGDPRSTSSRASHSSWLQRGDPKYGERRLRE